MIENIYYIDFSQYSSILETKEDFGVLIAILQHILLGMKKFLKKSSIFKTENFLDDLYST